MQGKLNRAKEEGFIFPLMIHRAVLATPAVILGPWTWTGWHTEVSGLPLTSNDYNVFKSNRQNPKRSCHYGQTKCNRKTEKPSQVQRKGKQSILHVVQKNAAGPNLTVAHTHRKRKWSKGTIRQHKETAENHMVTLRDHSHHCKAFNFH